MQAGKDDCIRDLDAKAVKPGRGFAVKCKGGKVILFSGSDRRRGSLVQTLRGTSL